VRRNQSGKYWNTLQAGENVNAYVTSNKAFTEHSMNNTIVAEPRFKMYNQDYIKDHLERRRRSASHFRERKKFSAIANPVHRNEVGPVSPGREENRAARSK